MVTKSFDSSRGFLLSNSDKHLFLDWMTLFSGLKVRMFLILVLLSTFSLFLSHSSFFKLYCYFFVKTGQILMASHSEFCYLFSLALDFRRFLKGCSSRASTEIFILEIIVLVIQKYLFYDCFFSWQPMACFMVSISSHISLRIWKRNFETLLSLNYKFSLKLVVLLISLCVFSFLCKFILSNICWLFFAWAYLWILSNFFEVFLWPVFLSFKTQVPFQTLFVSLLSCCACPSIHWSDMDWFVYSRSNTSIHTGTMGKGSREVCLGSIWKNFLTCPQQTEECLQNFACSFLHKTEFIWFIT